MQLDAKLEYSSLLSKQPLSNHLLIRLRTPPNSKNQRQPIVMGLAIDKSWSMKGPKMEAVIEASTSMINWLTRHDLISVIAYSHDVQIVQALTHLTEKYTIAEKIRSIEVGTSTNLSGGWLQALKSVESAKIENAYKRVILLTDGNPTLGIKEIELLIQIAKDHQSRGITTTVIGVGDDFNEISLKEMAQAGGGNFYYIESPEEASDIFFKEFGDIGSLYGQAVELNLKFAPGIKIKNVVNDLPSQVGEEFNTSGNIDSLSRQTLQIQVGDIRSDDIRNILVEIESENIQEGFPAVECELSYYNLTNKMKLEQTQTNVQMIIDQKSNPQDTDVMVEVLVASSGKIIQFASKLASEGKIDEAHDHIKKLISRIDNYKHHSPTSLGEISYRLKILDEKLGEKNTNASKHLLAEGTNLSFRGIDKLDLKDVKSHNEIYYIETEGEIDLYKCPEIRSNVESKLLLGYRYIIIDMNNTRHIDSSAIGTLIQIVGWLRRRGGELVVIGVKDNVKKIFEITKLFSHIRTFASKEEAKEWIQNSILSKE